MSSDMSDAIAQYNENFFRNQREVSLNSAHFIAPIVARLLQPRSVVDFGCGTGTWLHAFSACGVTDLRGYDGHHVDHSMLVIPAELFHRADLRAGLALDRRFDLAMSLEVAEHLPEASARPLVRSLVDAAPAVLFSAAIPGQGGTGHLNEQWQDYWRALFAEHGYQPVDCIRPIVRGRPEVRFWYQQNVILYCDAATLRAHPDLTPVADEISLDLVHPTLYSRACQVPSLRTCVRLLPRLMSMAVIRRLQPSR